MHTEQSIWVSALPFWSFFRWLLQCQLDAASLVRDMKCKDLEHIYILYRLSSIFPSTCSISIAKCCTTFYWFLNSDFTNAQEKGLKWMIQGGMWEYNIKYKIKHKVFFFTLRRNSTGISKIERLEWQKLSLWKWIYNIVTMKLLAAGIIDECFVLELSNEYQRDL